MEIANDPRVSENSSIDEAKIVNFLRQYRDALDIILRDIELSTEKFMRIVSLLRRLGRIPGGFEVNDSEWGIGKRKTKIA